MMIYGQSSVTAKYMQQWNPLKSEAKDALEYTWSGESIPATVDELGHVTSRSEDGNGIPGKKTPQVSHRTTAQKNGNTCYWQTWIKASTIPHHLLQADSLRARNTEKLKCKQKKSNWTSKMLTDSPNKKLSLTKLSNAAGSQMHLDLNPSRKIVHLYLAQRPRHDLCKLHSGLEKNNCTAQPRFINVVKPRVLKSQFRSPKLDELHLKIVYQLSL